MVEGLPALRQRLDAAYTAFRADPSFTHFDALQQAMNRYQRALNAWRDGDTRAGKVDRTCLVCDADNTTFYPGDMAHDRMSAFYCAEHHPVAVQDRIAAELAHIRASMIQEG